MEMRSFIRHALVTQAVQSDSWVNSASLARSLTLPSLWVFWGLTVVPHRSQRP